MQPHHHTGYFCSTLTIFLAIALLRSFLDLSIFSFIFLCLSLLSLFPFSLVLISTLCDILTSIHRGEGREWLVMLSLIFSLLAIFFSIGKFFVRQTNKLFLYAISTTYFSVHNGAQATWCNIHINSNRLR